MLQQAAYTSSYSTEFKRPNENVVRKNNTLVSKSNTMHKENRPPRSNRNTPWF